MNVLEYRRALAVWSAGISGAASAAQPGRGSQASPAGHGRRPVPGNSSASSAPATSGVGGRSPVPALAMTLAVIAEPGRQRFLARQPGRHTRTAQSGAGERGRIAVRVVHGTPFRHLVADRGIPARDPVGQLTAAELDRYASQLARRLKALDTSAPIRGHVQHELATVRAGQDARASSGPGDPPRRYDASGLTARELDRTRRELAASLALARPDSPARRPILAHLAALDAGLAARPGAGPGGSPGSPAA